MESTPSEPALPPRLIVLLVAVMELALQVLVLSPGVPKPMVAWVAERVTLAAVDHVPNRLKLWPLVKLNDLSTLKLLPLSDRELLVPRSWILPRPALKPLRERSPPSFTSINP